MKKTVLLTGATGFVGRQIYKHLLREDVEVRVVARQGSLCKLPELNSESKIFLTDDLFQESFDWWKSVLDGVDIIIHSAWYAEPGLYLQSPKNIDCLRGTIELAKWASHSGVKKFVGIGSCSEYDPADRFLSIITPLSPTTVYGGAKAAAYFALSNYLNSLKIDFLWCRLFYLFGQGDCSERLVPYLHSRISAGKNVELTNGNQVRDYLDVVVAGERIVKASLGNFSGPINICSGEPKTVRDLAFSIADIYGRRDLLKFGTRPENLFDPPYIVGVRGVI